MHSRWQRQSIKYFLQYIILVQKFIYQVKIQNKITMISKVALLI